jgi:hypothetical protein
MLTRSGDPVLSGAAVPRFRQAPFPLLKKGGETCGNAAISSLIRQASRILKQAKSLASWPFQPVFTEQSENPSPHE